MRILLIAIGAFIGLPMVVTLGLQLYAAIVVAGVASDVNAAVVETERAADQPPSGKYKVENVKADRSLRAGYEALVRVADPVRQRTVGFNAYVELRDMLHAGEEMPDADFADVFASARANAFAEAECGRVLKKLASKCEIDHVAVTRVRNKDDLYNISATLRFVQKDALGAVDPAAQLAYRELRKPLGDGDRAVIVMRDEAARQREKFYEAAARACGKLRHSEGNCAVYRITVRANPNRGSDAMELVGHAQLSYLQALRS